jgi:hypothetical protein
MKKKIELPGIIPNDLSSFAPTPEERLKQLINTYNSFEGKMAKKDTRKQLNYLIDEMQQLISTYNITLDQPSILHYLKTYQINVPHITIESIFI